MKQLVDQVIHQVVLDTDVTMNEKMNVMMGNLDLGIEQIRQQTSSSSTRADSDIEMVGGDDGGRRTSMRTSGPGQASATRLIVLGFEKPLLEASLK